MATSQVERAQRVEAPIAPTKPGRDAKFKVCPKCGDKILVAIEREICDECEIPYVTEADLATFKAKQEAEARAKEAAKIRAESELARAKKAVEEAEAKVLEG